MLFGSAWLVLGVVRKSKVIKTPNGVPISAKEEFAC